MPTSVLTVAIGAALWPAYTVEAPVRLLCLTLQLLAALTLPHMILDAWLERQDQPGRKDWNHALGLAALILPRTPFERVASRSNVPVNPGAP